MKTIKDFADYYGIDANNEISLFEYGLLIKQKGEEINVIVGITNDDNYEYDLFDSYFTTEKEINSILSESWFNKEAFLNCCGMSESEFMNTSIASRLYDMISYYGYGNILGGLYNPFEISKDE